VEANHSFIVLSDRGTCAEDAALPSLLATGAVHHHLIRKSFRTRVGIIVESAEPRDVHHFALLLGFGADCINPYLAYGSIRHLIRTGQLREELSASLDRYRSAVERGLLKILSKMGISTLRSYRGAQIFEALGLAEAVVERCFTGTPSRIGGAGFDIIAKETVMRHRAAFNGMRPDLSLLPAGGVHQWKKEGEFHLWNPETISALQESVRKGDYKAYKNFAEMINDQRDNPTTLRSLLRFKKARPIPLEGVEPAESILKRFATGAMSFGSISRMAHESLAIAMNRLGGRSNTGEGGEDPARFQALANGDCRRSAVKQVASGRFGVTINYLVNADELQIKIAQGAKPGEGGQLPGHKVSGIIARTRYTTPGVTLISPPPHHDIYSIEDLAQLIFDLKNANPRARISVKLVSEVGVGTVAAGVAKGHADMILISGGDGGTGASPRSSIHYAGLPWELGLAETHQTLVLNGLRSRVRLQTDGQMRTGGDVALAAILGAEEYGFCTAPLIALGCVMLRHCHLNNCSVGIATQDERLEGRFCGRVRYVENYFRFVAREVREVLASLGVRSIDELIGRTELVELNADSIPWKAKGIDYSKILYRPKSPKDALRGCTEKQNHGIDNVLDRRLISLSEDALESGGPVHLECAIRNSDRATGAMLSGEVCKRHGEHGLAGNTIHVKFKGVAGQSFGAFLAPGITFELEGLANDYVGKGISGGTLIVYPARCASYRAEENILIGNTTFYGAIAGEAYVGGVAGERFCIRNSGLRAVVEGVGDHGCEYMTGGRVVVLGRTGRNFAAGMSGGLAYVYDPDGTLEERCNTEMVLLETVTAEDEEELYAMIHNHLHYTGSSVAKRVLDDFQAASKEFVKVFPIEYKHIIEGGKARGEAELLEVSDG
jgi:glutamate synthase domain-containing protein 2/glutamate synthase domain-containing protein 3